MTPNDAAASRSAARDWRATRLTSLLGIEAPVALGAFGGASSVALTAAVSNAGGLGSYGLYGYSGQRILETTRALRTATDRPFALNLWLPHAEDGEGGTRAATDDRAFSEAAARLGLPLVEDNPYGELWFDTPPPPPVSATAGDGAIYLGSFSKVLAPGLRLGYVLAPAALCGKLLQAKQSADLHTPGFNQRVAYEVIRDGFLDTHLPAVRARYKAQRDAMHAALQRHLPSGCTYTVPAGGMFFWVELPEGLDATALLPQAVEAGMAYVPGAPFYSGVPRTK